MFEEMFEGSFISRETHRRFFHKFVEMYSTQIFPQVVRPPADDDLPAIRRMMHPYSLAGFAGCIGSVDCTHFWWEATPAARINACKGKEGYCTVAAQFTVNHWREILHVTPLFNGATNDKVFDHFVSFILHCKI